MDALEREAAKRSRRRHTEEFKRQVIEACQQPGVTVAAVALANGLNANQLRRWVRAHGKASAVGGRSEAALRTAHSGTRVPVTVVGETSPNRPAQEIRIDLQRGGGTVRMAWPLEAADRLGPCLRELLR